MLRSSQQLGVVEGATEDAAIVQSLLDNLIERGLAPEVCRLFIVDGAKALSKAIRRTFVVEMSAAFLCADLGITA